METQKVIKITGVLIAIFNMLNVINGAWFFLAIAKFPPVAWLAFNICAPSVAVYLAGYVLKKDWIMTAAIPFLLFFGTGGLFVFGWSGTSIYAQIGHIAMTLATLWIIFKLAAGKKFILPATGFAAGIVLLLFIFPVQQNYVKSHPEYIKILGDSRFEEFINNKR